MFFQQFYALFTNRYGESGLTAVETALYLSKDNNLAYSYIGSEKLPTYVKPIPLPPSPVGPDVPANDDDYTWQQKISIIIYILLAFGLFGTIAYIVYRMNKNDGVIQKQTSNQAINESLVSKQDSDHFMVEERPPAAINDEPDSFITNDMEEQHNPYVIN